MIYPTQPPPVPQPTVGSSINDYISALPQLYQAQLDFAPREAQQQLDLLKNYGLDYAKAYQDIQNQLNPEISGLTKSLAQQAQDGLNNGIPQALRDQYASDFRALAGDNVNAGSGADFVSKNLLQQDLAFKQYNQNLSLSLAGMQPLAQPMTPNYTNQLGQFNPGQALGLNQNMYNAQLGYYRPQISSSQSGNFAGTLGSVIGGVGAGLTGFGAVKSSFK